MTKRAAIYVRVSSERQALRVSPEAQEADCRAYCAQHGYAIVDAYRDIEKYRIGSARSKGRLVEPSGTRADRPQLRRMLADANAGRLDVIVAWKEDRLYRGLRPMLDVLECIEANDLDVGLVKETFDRKMAPIKAAIAKMELEAKNDRTVMGISGRVASGRAWNSHAPYGYRSADGHYQIDECEAGWVRQIWSWYASGESVREIRRRLIAAGAPQSRQPGLDQWGLPRIRKLLRYETYVTGMQQFRIDGRTFEIPCPPIVDQFTAELVAKRRAQHRRYPAGHVKYDYLGLGLVYCAACGWKMHVVTRNRRGTPEGEYRCPKAFFGYPEHDCPKRVGWHKLDERLWEAVNAYLADDALFETAIADKIDALRREESDAEGRAARIESRLEALSMERQKVITAWRQGRMTDADYDLQLGGMTIEQKGLERELAEARLLTGNRAERLIEFANDYRHNIRAGLAGLLTKPGTPEEAGRQFEIKRRAVETLVTRVDVAADKSLRVTFALERQIGTLPAAT